MMSYTRRSMIQTLAATPIIATPFGVDAKRRRTALSTGTDVIVVPGQSNGEGYGMGNFSQSDTSADGIITQIGRHTSNNMQIVPFSEKLDFWPAAGQAHGYVPSLTRYYAQAIMEAGRNPGIVPSAHGETSILEWLELVSGKDPGLYTDMATRIAVYLSQVDGTHRIVLHDMDLLETDILIIGNPSHPWHSMMPDADTFYARMLDYIDKFRGDFGPVPFIFSKASPVWNPPAKDGVEAALLAITTERPNVRLVSTDYVLLNGSVGGAGYAHIAAQGQETQAVRHFIYASELVTGTQYTSANALSNGAFDTWSAGTSFPIQPNTQITVSDNWTAFRAGAGNATISRQAGFNGAAYCLRMQRDAGTSDTQTISIFQRIPDSIAASFAGKKVTIAYGARLGADFSGYLGRMKACICTAPGTGEPFDEHTRTFTSTTTISPQYLNMPYTTPERWFNTFYVPDTCTELVLQMDWAPTGIASMNDYVDLSAVYLCLGIVPMGITL